jgi:hypothetical protein
LLLAYQGPAGWWAVDGYNARNVIHFEPGLFNLDSYGDLMAAYYYDGDTTRFHVFRSTGSALVYTGPAGWWSSTGYPLPKETITDTAQGDSVLADLSQNYPNPFNPTTTISYTIPEASHVRLEIFNILGQLVEPLVDDNQAAGEHSVQWNASQYATGVYFYRFTVGNETKTKKMLLIK